MKSSVLFVFVLGVVGVIANTVSKQASADDNNEQIGQTTTESQTKHEEIVLNKGGQEQKISTIELDTVDMNGGEVDLVIEENINDITHLPLEYDDELEAVDPFSDTPQVRVEGEIMETAAGFVPTPILFKRRNKNKLRRRFATRRHFRRNPYRRYQFYYPYYSFYPYRRSLRFY